MFRLLNTAMLLTFVMTSSALAHHPLAGKPMETFFDGILSGIGHPILGFDHLFFVIAVGIASLFTGRALSAPLAFVIATLFGVGIIIMGIQLPLVEYMIALSLVALGGIVLSGQRFGLTSILCFFATAGLFHGWAFGETIVGQENINADVLAGYLSGLMVIQWLVAVGAGLFVTSSFKVFDVADTKARIIGGIVAGAGAVFLLEGLETALFSALGLV
jgi:urease accessory protein